VAVPAAEVATVAGWFGDRALVVAGGASRQQSVAAALAALPGRYDVVLVHDAARPLVPPGLVEAVIDAVSAGAPAVVPGVVPVDTVKRVDTAGLVRETLPREQLRAVQTPQGFRHDVLEAAHAAAGTGTGTGDVAGATDDAGLVELIGVPVLVIPGDVRAAKITSAADLALAEWALASSAGPA
jgi:2-C-methyl-D-erythritol 4-phosphate cytidylyltransferase